jgi:cell division septation protein DedD
MSLDFSFDKKSAVAILVGCILVGALLFMAGFLVGRDSKTVETLPAVDKKNSSKVPVKIGGKPAAADSASAEPIVAGEQGVAKPAANVPDSGQAASLQIAKSSASTTPVTTGSQARSSEPQTRNSNASATTSPAQSGASSEKTPSSEKDADAPTHSFSVQCGAFQVRDKAQYLLKRLQSRGYPAFVFDTRDSNGRVWYTVRMGHYTSIKKARHDAALFTGREQMPTSIRADNEL